MRRPAHSRRKAKSLDGGLGQRAGSTRVCRSIDRLTWSPRGVDSVCEGSKNGVNFPRGIRDAMQAADHLGTLPYVDKRRIAHIGFSWGAMVALMGSSKDLRGVLPGSDGFSARIDISGMLHNQTTERLCAV